jgi:hypothetical protein
MALSATQTGRAAEHLVCYLLELNGIDAHHLNSTADILAIVKSGKVLRIEVKAANPTPARRAGSVYGFHANNKGRADFYAFVAVDLEAAIFAPSREITKQFISIPQSDFSWEQQVQTIIKLGET